MKKILLVDDEVLAMNYLKNLVNWEQNGFSIMGCVTSGEKAIQFIEKNKPDVVISDIKMIGMDGLELTQKIKKTDPGIKVILLSAYKDFAYAQKGIQYGVQDYLLKHELCEASLVQKLSHLKSEIEQSSKKEQIYQEYFLNQLIMDKRELSAENIQRIGNRICMLYIHRDSELREGEFYEQELQYGEQGAEEKIEESIDDMLYYLAHVEITPANHILFYRIENTVSKYKVNRLIEQKSNDVLLALKKQNEGQINVLYSGEIRQEEISDLFRKMSAQVRNAVFWKPGICYAQNRLNEIVPQEKNVLNTRIAELENAVYKNDNNTAEIIAYMFEQTVFPRFHVDGLKHLIHLLDNSVQKLEKREGIVRCREEKSLCKMKDIQEYYISSFGFLAKEMQINETQKYSKIVLEIMRYVRKNYSYDLSLELIGDLFHMNGVYLGQVFKKETGTTLLKFITNTRIDAAKHFLEEGTYTISEVAEKVGYKTSQYFSQIFSKSVGMTPQEYRKWNQEY